MIAGPRGIADALRILAEGGEVDYEGASGSMDWDENGDLRRGHIGIWRFVACPAGCPATGHDAGFQPLDDQPDHPPILDSVLEEPDQPVPRNGIEGPPDTLPTSAIFRVW